MQKSIYSLVLMDDVIAAVDKEAYRLNTSRSNLINQILAEHLACVTPEMKMQEIFNSISDMLEAHFQIQQQSPNSLLSAKKSLHILIILLFPQLMPAFILVLFSKLL